MAGNSNGRLAERAPLAILGVPFDAVTRSEAIQRIVEMVESRRPHYLVTANVDFLVQARHDVELRRILLEAHLVLCDGTPVVWASRLLGNPLPERVAGADLAPDLIRVAAEKNYRLFFLGATPESSSQAATRLQAQFPNLIVAGNYSPPFRHLLEMDHEEIKRRILEARPDILFVSFGCPKQEKWIAMHYRGLGVPVIAGVGATIDFLAGRVPRAPSWMQKSGTEWLYRLVQEPRRLYRRYARDLRVFSWALFAQWLRLGVLENGRLSIADARAARSGRSECPQAGLSLLESPFKNKLNANSPFHLIRVPERLDLTAAQKSNLNQVPTDGCPCFLDMSSVTFVDSTGIALLLGLKKRVLAGGGRLVLLTPTAVVRRALRLMRLEQFILTAPDLPSALALIEERNQEETACVMRSDPTDPAALAWRGEVTAANADKFWERTRALVPTLSGARQWLIDLSGVRFIDSTGLRVMLRVKRAAEQQGIQILFSGFQPAVRNVLRLGSPEHF